MPRGSVPEEVERYAKRVRASNPFYSEAAVWATAWSIFCKSKKPKSPHCKLQTSEYFNKRRRAARLHEDIEAGRYPPSRRKVVRPLSLTQGWKLK
jgi:hypothetical protein